MKNITTQYTGQKIMYKMEDNSTRRGIIKKIKGDQITVKPEYSKDLHTISANQVIANIVG